MTSTFNYTLPDVSNIEFSDATIVNNLLNDIKTTDISNMTHTTLEKSIALKNSQTIVDLKNLADFLQKLEVLNKSLEE